MSDDRHVLPPNLRAADPGWGPQDELGAANRLGPEAARRGMAAVRAGRAISLAAPIRSGEGFGLVGRPAPAHYMLRSGADYAAGLAERGFGFSDDVVVLPTHGATHVDALAHVWSDGRMYNDFSAHEVTSRGARRLGIDKLPPVVTRGVLVDVAPPGGVRDSRDPVHVDELIDLLDKRGVALEPGDALLVRTGWLAAAVAGACDARSWPGLHHDCADWLVDRGVVLVGADNPGVECFPSYDPDCQVPLHLRLLRDHGIYLVELMALDDLCAADRSSFLFMLSALPLVGAVGSPVAPVAVV